MIAFITIAVIMSRTADRIIAYCPIYNEYSEVVFTFDNWGDLTSDEKHELIDSDWRRTKEYRNHRPYTENFQLSIITKQIEL